MRIKCIAFPLLVIAVFALIAFPGCGGGDDDETNASGVPASGKESTESAQESSREEDGGKSSEAGSGTGESTSGEGTQGGQPKGKPITDTQFVKQANAICEAGHQRVVSEYQPYVDAGLKAVEQGSDEMVNEIMAPTLEGEINKIRALGLPASSSDEIEAMFAAMQEAIDTAKEDPGTFILAGAPFAEPEKLAAALGLDDCGGTS